MRTLILLLLGLAACRVGAPHETVRIAVVVNDDAGLPLAAVPLMVDGKTARATDHEGRATLQVSGVPNHRLQVRAQCPEAYRPSEPRTVSLGGATQLSLRFQCRPKLRTLAVVVHAPHAEGLTIRADGEPVGKVGADGTLHVVLKRKPDAELRLMLDTSNAPLLRPQNPIEDFVVPDRDEIVVFDQSLAMASVTRRAKVQAPSPKIEPRHIPYAIGRR